MVDVAVVVGPCQLEYSPVKFPQKDVLQASNCPWGESVTLVQTWDRPHGSPVSMGFRKYANHDKDGVL